MELLSDGHTVAPLIRLGYLHSLRGGRSYFLHFKHQSGERDFPQVKLIFFQTKFAAEKLFYKVGKLFYRFFLNLICMGYIFSLIFEFCSE